MKLSSYCASLAVFLFAATFSLATTYPSVQALTEDSLESVSINFLENVAGFNMTIYNVESFETFTARSWDQHLETHVHIILKNGDEQIDVHLTFVDGAFWSYDISLPPDQTLLGSEKSLSDYLILAKRAVQNFGALVNLTWCEDYANMISENIAGDSTIENQNAILEVVYNENCSTQLDTLRYVKFRWFDKKDNFTIPRLSLALSKTGLVTTFLRNLCYVATTEVDISEEEAISIARSYAESYAAKHNLNIVSVNATLKLERDWKWTRGSDNYAMYPGWLVFFTFDRVENGVIGYSVLIWADSGTVYDYGPQGFYTDGKADAPLSGTVGLIVAAILSSIIAVQLMLRKRGK
ncbi:hypothetical protein DRO54_06020 [Candidatus Bathyarchaeota archaeon]|nr:MAG: hypothetical protein DRO54_06020 [Candidatus Bathyarchaeota archaeon]